METDDGEPLVFHSHEDALRFADQHVEESNRWLAEMNERYKVGVNVFPFDENGECVIRLPLDLNNPLESEFIIEDILDAEIIG